MAVCGDCRQLYRLRPPASDSCRCPLVHFLAHRNWRAFSFVHSFNGLHLIFSLDTWSLFSSVHCFSGPQRPFALDTWSFPTFVAPSAATIVIQQLLSDYAISAVAAPLFGVNASIRGSIHFWRAHFLAPTISSNRTTCSGIYHFASIIASNVHSSSRCIHFASTIASMEGARPTVDALYDAVESAVSDTHSWDAQLFFKLSPGFLLSEQSPNVFGLPFTEQDLFDVGSGTAGSTGNGIKFYFDPTEFPFDGDFKTSTDTWPNLSRRLVRSAAENGYNLMQRGQNTKDKYDTKTMHCVRWVKASASLSTSTGPSDYRPTLEATSLKTEQECLIFISKYLRMRQLFWKISVFFTSLGT